MINRNVKTDAVVAAADLGSRAGAKSFQIMWDCPHQPDAGEDHGCPDVVWTCEVAYKGARLFSKPFADPEDAADDLAYRLLANGRCRCGEIVGVGCVWVREGAVWVPGCDVPSIPMDDASRGDLVALNRAQRRAQQRRKKR